MRNVTAMASKGKAKVTCNGSQSVGASGGPSGVVKPERTRRSWSKREEEVMIMALHDIVAGGWKADNGFRPGHSKMIYNVLKREIPNTELRVSPHINSKIATWKRDYHSLSNILNRSGIGFNSDCGHRIECNDDQWAQIVKSDSHAKHMRHKAWPFYEDWKMIFGKDRASGGRAEEVSEADDVLHGSDASIADESQPTMSPYHLDDFFTEEQINEGLNYDGHGFDAFVDSDTKSIPSPPAPKKALRKRKVEEVMESMLDAMTKMNENTSDRLNTLSMRIGYDFDLSTKRVEVAKMLDGIPEITKKQKFMACDILVKEPERLDLFSGFSIVDKADYIIHILEEKLAM
ncbi:hypothetical protein SASPL_117739 [Salvia splendens]|uniref:Myb/SANT-like domain-containing protein n=1 Tax=Salvia splendens TaxID=180675 RepID=A0A8X8XY43_SALSN|nr:hypothetical protein SASPL_117739 [Salvia splendens]